MTDPNLALPLDEALARDAMRAYERGRAVKALAPALFAALLTTSSVVAGAPLSIALVGGALLVAIAFAAAHHGRSFARAVWPGLIVGAVPVLTALLATRVGHACAGGVCVPWCAPLCFAGGAAAGAFAARAFTKDRDSGFLATLFSLGAIGATLGCLPIGAGGVLGLGIGLVFGSAPALVIARAR